MKTGGRLNCQQIAVLAILCGALVTDAAQAQWPQWGGPHRNFKVDAEGLADSWPEDGPPKLWHRKLGDGYSAIVVDDGLLYTMYRKAPTAEHEFTIALDARTGETLWEHKNPARILEPPNAEYGGHGPNSTPLVVGDCLYSIGSRAVLHAFDKRTGKVLWGHDLVGEFHAEPGRTTGYCPSPIAYQNMIIVRLGRKPPEERAPNARLKAEGNSLIAFDRMTGSPLWRSLDCETSFSSPILIKIRGEDQLVLSSRAGLIGVNPDNGALLWHQSVDEPYATFITPVWNGEDLLFLTAGDAGRTIRLASTDGRTTSEEICKSAKVKIRQPTPVQVGGFLYGSNERALLGVNFSTGKRAWYKRGFPTASCIYASGKLIILDENGQLTLATATPEGLTVHSQCKITEKYSFSVPALADKILYVRDRKHIMALDLG